MATNLKIDGDRLWQSLMEMAKIGATEKGGNCRLALTDLDKQGRELFIAWAKAAGCTIGVDQMGNVFARRKGRNDALPPVVTGSHLDTQPAGGSMACSACSPGSRSCARSTTPASRPRRRSRSWSGPTRRARASRRR
jgi:hypothetical protein